MKHKNFFMLPNKILECGLKSKEFTVYCCLVRHSDKDKSSCFPSRSIIARECNMDILLNTTCVYEGTLQEFYQIKVSVYSTDKTVKNYIDTLEDWLVSNIHIYVKAKTYPT